MASINLTIDGVINIFRGLACWGLSVMVSVIIIFIVVAGIRFMASGGDSEQYAKAKKNFGWLLIGILVIFGFNVILQSVAGNLGRGEDPLIKSLIPFRCSN